MTHARMLIRTSVHTLVLATRANASLHMHVLATAASARMGIKAIRMSTMDAQVLFLLRKHINSIDDFN